MTRPGHYVRPQLDAAQFAAAVNAAAQVSDPARAASVFTTAVQQARGVASELLAAAADQAVERTEQIRDRRSRAAALVSVVRCMARVDPRHAGRTTDRAEALIATFGNPNARGEQQVALALALGPADPHRAETLAESITPAGYRADALARLARIEADPEHARRLADRALAAATAEDSALRQAQAHLVILDCLAVVDRDLAEQAATRAESAAELTQPDDRDSMLRRLAYRQAEVFAAMDLGPLVSFPWSGCSFRSETATAHWVAVTRRRELS